MRQDNERFLVLFARLKSALNNSPKNLKWLPEANPEIAELCYQLDTTYDALKHDLASRPNKHAIVPSIFQARWDEYISNYQARIHDIAGPIRAKYEKELRAIFEQEANAKGQPLSDFIHELYDLLPRKMGSTFNPVEDNAAELLNDIFSTIYNIVINDEMPEVFTDAHMGALNYFEKVIGVNFAEINRRWAVAPNIFISEKVKKKTDKLVEMYHEAVRCYIYGLNVSATAMCRALLEHILLNYYGLPKDDLVNVVSLAEKKFKKLQVLNLHKLRKDGNDVLHEYETKSKIEDAAVVSYLLTIRSLVGFVPDV